jgi:hypothetical protein
MSALDRAALRADLIDVIDGEYEGNESDGQIADRMISVFDKHLQVAQAREGMSAGDLRRIGDVYDEQQLSHEAFIDLILDNQPVRQTINRDTARRKVMDWLITFGIGGRNAEGCADRILTVLASVRPAPQTLDREALGNLLQETRYSRGAEWTTDRLTDAVLALVQPVEGVVLTRDEAGHAADWHDYIVDQGGEVPAEQTEIALRLRRGATS